MATRRVKRTPAPEAAAPKAASKRGRPRAIVAQGNPRHGNAVIVLLAIMALAGVITGVLYDKAQEQLAAAQASELQAAERQEAADAVLRLQYLGTMGLCGKP